MKVEEAKNKVCPFMSQYTIEKTDNNWQNKCVCGDCMAWVYTKEKEEEYHGYKLPEDEKEGYCARLGRL